MTDYEYLVNPSLSLIEEIDNEVSFFWEFLTLFL